MSKDHPGREVATVEDGGQMMATIQNARAKGIPIATVLMTNPALMDAASRLAKAMSLAAGVVPAHLLGKPEACFAVLCKSQNWGLDAFEVAQATYQTPGGSIGYYGRLVNAVLSSHPKVDRPVFRDLGDWSVLHGKFEMAQGKKQDANGNPIKYARPTWKPEDERGLGVEVWCRYVDGTESEHLEIWLAECNPRNATTWPTRPRLQIRNVAIRALANSIEPGLFMGTRFYDDDDEVAQGYFGPDRAKDVTPAADSEPAGSKLDKFKAKHTAKPKEESKAPEKPQDEQKPSGVDEDTGEVVDDASATDGEAQGSNPLVIVSGKGKEYPIGDESAWLAEWGQNLDSLRKADCATVTTWLENNLAVFEALGELAEPVKRQLEKLRDDAFAKEEQAAAGEGG